MNLIDKVKKLKDDDMLPRGWTVTIAKAMKVTKEYVSDVSCGRYPNDNILIAIVELAEAKEAMLKDIDARLDRLTQPA